MIDRPIQYRPPGVAISRVVIAATVVLPVLLLVWAREPVLALIAAIVFAPIAVILWVLVLPLKLRLTNDGVYLRTTAETVMLAWEDIRKFDCLQTVIIYTKHGTAHEVPWLATAPIPRWSGDLGRGDWAARDLNVLLMEQTGRERPDVDTGEIAPKLTADSAAGRARLAKAGWVSFVASTGVLPCYFYRSWWALLPPVVIGLAWLAVRRRQREAGK